MAFKIVEIDRNNRARSMTSLWILHWHGREVWLLGFRSRPFSQGCH